MAVSGSSTAPSVESCITGREESSWKLFINYEGAVSAPPALLTELVEGVCESERPPLCI